VTQLELSRRRLAIPTYPAPTPPTSLQDSHPRPQQWLEYAARQHPQKANSMLGRGSPRAGFTGTITIVPTVVQMSGIMQISQNTIFLMVCVPIKIIVGLL
jgi:hypothetical protein